MRQMDTILVAVGVPTKETPGALITLPENENVEQDSGPQRDCSENQVIEPENTVEMAETKEKEKVWENEEVGDGWDIPDISYLLGSSSDTETENQTTDHLPPTVEDNDSNKDCGGQSAAADEGEPLDNEHVSWSWDDTHWTTEQK